MKMTIIRRIICIVLTMSMVLIFSPAVFATHTASGTIAGVNCYASVTNNITSGTAWTSCNSSNSVCSVSVSHYIVYRASGSVTDMTKTASGGNIQYATATATPTGYTAPILYSSTTSTHTAVYSNQSWSTSLAD